MCFTVSIKCHTHAGYCIDIYNREEITEIAIIQTLITYIKVQINTMHTIKQTCVYPVCMYIHVFCPICVCVTLYTTVAFNLNSKTHF